MNAITETIIEHAGSRIEAERDEIEAERIAEQRGQ